MYILGISAFYHDSAACLMVDGNIVAAAQEERFSRIKHDASFPTNAIKFCLSRAGIRPSQLHNVVFYEKPFLKFERLFETYLAFAPRGFSSFAKAIPLWVKDKLFQKQIIAKELAENFDEAVDWSQKLLFSEHHISHAASAFFPSPFKDAAVLTLDGVGEWTTSSVGVGSGNKLEILKEMRFPHSLGLLYSAFTYYTGFKVNSGEYKVMGLAPYGSPIYYDLIMDKLVDVADDGSFQLDMSYFGFATGMTMTNKKFDRLFGAPRRIPETNLTQREMDLAASIQKVTEEIILRIGKSVARETGHKKLCLAGGVALNCVANGLLVREGVFEDIWIQPAAGDAGGALGAAAATWHIHYNKERHCSIKHDAMQGAYLGPEYSEEEIGNELIDAGARFETIEGSQLFETVAQYLANQKAVGWMQGRMEFGPRALGNRSIIADPRSPLMQKQLNMKVKFRESFRPFAPSVLFEDVEEWFDCSVQSPYMLLVADVAEDKRRSMSANEKSLFGIEKLNVPRSIVPAITHVDYTARLQTVHKHTNPTYHALLSKFKEITGVPLLVNTSFNIRGEPIICNPTDAFRCFMGTDLDILVIGNHVLSKEDQEPSLLENYQQKYELD